MKKYVLKDIPGHEGRYKASSDGRIYSCLTCKFLSKSVHKNTGYELVNLTYKNASQRVFYVHRLVTFAFFGKAPKGIQVNHKNGDRCDNNITNLEYVTHKQNQRHSWDELGRLPSINRGENSGNAKLTNESVLTMRRMYATGKYTYKELGKKFGISGGHASKVINMQAWSHI